MKVKSQFSVELSLRTSHESNCYKSDIPSQLRKDPTKQTVTRSHQVLLSGGT